MKREDFNKNYERVNEDQYDTTDPNTMERVLLIRVKVQEKSNPTNFKRVSARIPITRTLDDLKTLQGEAAYQQFLEDRIQTQIDIDYNITE